MWGQGAELGLTGLSRSRVTRFHGRSDSEGPMGAVTSSFPEKSRLAALLEHFSQIEDPRDPWRVAHPLPEVLLLAVCGTIADCDDYDHIHAWGERTDERRVGKECVSTCRIRWSPSPKKKNIQKNQTQA